MGHRLVEEQLPINDSCQVRQGSVPPGVSAPLARRRANIAIMGSEHGMRFLLDKMELWSALSYSKEASCLVPPPYGSLRGKRNLAHARAVHAAWVSLSQSERSE